MTVEEMRKALKDMNLSAVAKSSGVPYYKVLRFASGETQDPSYEMVQAIERYLASRAGDGYDQD